MNDAITPTAIRQHGKFGLFVTWADGHESLYAVRELRLACQCAMCVHEVTRVPILDPKTVPEDVRPKEIASVGRYGIQITWSDGHKTGITTFRALRSMCPCPVCRPQVLA